MDCKYQQLAELLEHGITGGEYPAGAFLPGERALCDRFQLSRVTVRNSLGLLVKKHLVSPVAGRGYQVLGKRPLSNRVRTRLAGGVFPGAPQVNSEYMHVPYRLSHAIGRTLEGDDYSLVIADSSDDLLRERECVQRLLRRGVEGLVAMPSFSGGPWGSTANEAGNYAWYRELYRNGLPVVLMDRQLTGEGVPGVYNDDVAGGAMQAEYMLGRGFRQIIFFECALDRLSSMRCSGYYRAMLAAGLVPRQVTPSEFRISGEWLTPGPRHEAELEAVMPYIQCDTALICSNFLVPALEKRFPGNRHGSHRVEWICYDYRAGWGNVPCRPYPCVVRPTAEIGERAARKLLRLLDGDDSAATAELLFPQITF